MRNAEPTKCEFPYHLCARTNERMDFGPPLGVVWTHMENYLHFIYHAYDVRIYSFVLMPNHFHLIARFPRGNLGSAMNYFMRETSKAIARDGDRENHLWGTRVFRSMIRSSHYFSHAYKYVYRNPVEANLANRVEEYFFSTLPSLLGLKHGLIPLEEDNYLFNDIDAQVEWLNRSPLEADRVVVRAALRRNEFSIPRARLNQKMHPLETLRY
jgi:putative transposase